MICFDIGANVGEWSLANKHNFDKIIAVEASSHTFRKLSRQTRFIKNIESVNKAVTDAKGIIDFFHAKHNLFSTTNNNWLNNKDMRFYGLQYTTITAQCISIDELIQLYGIPSLIKIDVEGGEFNTIKSLTSKVDTLCFEWTSEAESITHNCLDYLETIGFTEFFIQMHDNYLFRPKSDDYVDKNTVMDTLSKKQKMIDWGMMWCK